MRVTVAVVTIGKSRPSIAGVFTGRFEDWAKAYYGAGGFNEITVHHTNGITEVWYDNESVCDVWNLEIHDVDAEPTW